MRTVKANVAFMFDRLVVGSGCLEVAIKVQAASGQWVDSINLICYLVEVRI